MTTRLGILSDTHMPRFGRALPAALREGLRTAGLDLVVHLGDLTSPDVLDQLERIAPVVAVAGNNDPPELVRRLGRRRLVEVEGARIGLVHGDEGRGARTVDRAVAAFADEIRSQGVAAVLYGHSHIPAAERRDGVLLLNPGSPTDKRRQALYSYAILEVEDGRLEPRIVTYADRTP